jgi:signal transduction histidine kinase
MHRRIAVVAAGAIAMTVVSVLGHLGNPPESPFVAVYRKGFSAPEIVREVVVAWAFIGAGLIIWYQRSASRIGPLMIAIGTALLLHGFQYLPVPVLVTLGMWLGIGLSGVLLGILLLAYPSGHIRSRLDRTWIALGLSHALGLQLVLALVTPRPPDASSEACCRPLVVLFYDDKFRKELSGFVDLTFGLLAILLIGLLIRRWMVASRPARQSLTPILFAGLLIALVALGNLLRPSNLGSTGEAIFWKFWAVQPASWAPVLWDYLPWVRSLSMLLVPLALLWLLFRRHLRHSSVSALAVELGRTGPRRPLVDALRRALGDASLELAFWSRPAGIYVSPAGEALRLPDESSERAVTHLDADDGPLAALIHDPALSEQRALVDGVAAVARLSIENERLHAEVKAQLEEVRASRERIVRAADEERRRVERNLHDGAQQRLVSLSLALGMAQAQMAGSSPAVAATLAEAEAELREAIGELRELARGIHPAILTEAGLAAALETLADHSPVPVHLEAEIADRLSPLVEATAYFVAAEALTNVAKYAAANSVELRATVAEGWLRLIVADDGVGGADPERGSGLRGLLDRVAALGGRLSIDSALGGGTRLTAEIPCAQRASRAPLLTSQS